MTFFSYPENQWKSLRSTTITEQIYCEFQRRIKTRTGFPSEGAVLIILYGLLTSSQIRLEQISGLRDMLQVFEEILDRVA